MATPQSTTDSFVRQVVLGGAAPILSLDGSGAVVFASERTEELLGYQPGELEGSSLKDFLAGDGDARSTLERIHREDSLSELVLQHKDGHPCTVTVLATTVETGGEQFTTATLLGAEPRSRQGTDEGGPDQSVGTPLQGADTVPGQDGDRDLHTASRALSLADDRANIAAIVVESIDEAFDVDLCCVRLLDHQTGTLQVVAATEETWGRLRSDPGWDLEATFAGRAFRRGEPIYRPATERQSGADASVRATLHLPLGSHGTLTVASTKSDGIAPSRRERLGLLAGDLRSALGRAGREQALQSQTQSLRQQRDEFRLVSKLASDLVDVLGDGATAEADLPAQVCRRLVDSGPYRSVWFGELSPDGQRLVGRASASVDGRQILGGSKVPVGTAEDCALAEALSSGTPTTEQRLVADESRPETDGTVRRVTILPMVVGERRLGALLLTAEKQRVHRPASSEALNLLAGVAGAMLLASRGSDGGFQQTDEHIEFTTTDSRFLPVTVSETLGGQCRLCWHLASDDTESLSFLHVEDAPVEQASTEITDLESVSECHLLVDAGNARVFRVRHTVQWPETVGTVDCSLVRLIGNDGTGTLTISTSLETDVQSLVAELEASASETSLVGATTVSGESRSPLTSEAVTDTLTWKQREAVTTAYFAGYFEWPRQTTAEEVAELMGIASATFHQHIRQAQDRLLTALLG